MTTKQVIALVCMIAWIALATTLITVSLPAYKFLFAFVFSVSSIVAWIYTVALAIPEKYFGTWQ